MCTQGYNIDSLPVAPEFVTVLVDDATETAVAALEVLQAPAAIITLVSNIKEMGFYLKLCATDPTDERLGADPFSHFAIEGLVIETINAIAAAGGNFTGHGGATTPRPNRPKQHRRHAHYYATRPVWASYHQGLQLPAPLEPIKSQKVKHANR